MKRAFAVPLIIALAIFCAGQKQQTEEERNAEIEPQVQQRLAAKRHAQAEQQLAQREAQLDAREKALAEKQKAAPTTAMSQAPQIPIQPSMTDASGNPATASYSTFYTKLEPYGIWRETSNYGYVWQPREAEQSRAWRPYTNGRWVYTDAGWTWVSEEPFGWATYHYGRWTRLRNIGWVWVPGEQWAPAWVSWRKSNDYVGWAPLPPEARFDQRTGIHNWADNYYDIGPDQYCFLPTNQFGTRRVETAVVPAERNATIVNQTTNVTNITYNNTTIVNQGPSYDELRVRSEQPIERLRIERQIAVNQQGENPRPVIRGEVIQMPAPVIARAQPAERPRSVREKVAQTVVDSGWEGIADRQAAEKARAKIKSESTPPLDAPPKTFVKPPQAASETSPISTPALASPTAYPTRPPLASPTPAPRQTTPGASPKIRVATASPTAPSRRAAPIATATAAPELTPSPAVTATPHPRETTTITPYPTFSPRRHASPTPSPSASAPNAFGVIATPSVAPTDSGSTSPPLGRSIESKPHGKTEKELRKEEWAAQRQQRKDESQKVKTPSPEGSPGETATASPLTSQSLGESPRKEEKKKHKRERAGSSEKAETASPSPSVSE
jgi:Family of unknown function (DUF6600)